jgi:hypothetical protein
MDGPNCAVERDMGRIRRFDKIGRKSSGTLSLRLMPAAAFSAAGAIKLARSVRRYDQ